MYFNCQIHLGNSDLQTEAVLGPDWRVILTQCGLRAWIPKGKLTLQSLTASLVSMYREMELSGLSVRHHSQRKTLFQQGRKEAAHLSLVWKDKERRNQFCALLGKVTLNE